MEKGIYKIVKGDVTKLKQAENEKVIIPHVCNNLGGWAKGFVLALSKEWPETEKKYKDWIKAWRTDNPPEKLLGRVAGILKVTIYPYPTVYVANMIAQDGYKSANNPKPLKYWALVKCMREVARFAKDNKCTIHCPKFGSLRSGGNWNFIEELIKEIWVEKEIDVTVYEWVE